MSTPPAPPAAPDRSPAVARTPHPDAPGHEAVALSADRLTATFVPTAGMVGCSLTDDGVELLGQRGGLADYLARGKTFGIPLLAPWANRLGALSYVAAGRRVDVDPATPGVHLDDHGLPIHGVLAASPDWAVVEAAADDQGAWLRTCLEHDGRSPRFAAFPFAHRLEVEVALTGRALRVATTLTPTGPHDVPVAFGWHPYLAPPEAPRADWVVAPATTARAVLDARSLPTGEIVEDPSLPGPLGSRTLDELLADVADGAQAEVVAAGRRLVVRYVEGYRWAVVFAPASPDVVCLEAMTAPTDPFAGRFTGERATRVVPAGGPAFTATWELHVPSVGSPG